MKLGNKPEADRQLKSLHGQLCNVLSKDGCMLGFFLVKNFEMHMENSFLSITKPTGQLTFP